MIYSFIYIVISILILFYSGDFLVKGSSVLAKKIGLSQFFIGLTVVAFGTSLPEFFVSFTAILNGSDEISVANILGSNIANIGVVLGMAFLLIKKIEFKNTNKLNLLFFLLSTVLFFVISFFSKTNRYYSLFLFLIFILFIYFSFRKCKDCGTYDEPQSFSTNILLNIFIVILGISGLYFGSNLLVINGVKVARYLGVSELLIGATVMAVGTSLPELTASVVSIIRKNNDIAIANVIGSNIFNVLCAFSLVSLYKPIKINSSLKFLDFPFLILMTTLTIYSFYSKKYKKVGLALLISYLVYVSLIIYRN